MQTERIKEERVLIRVKKLDSMGRTSEIRKAMELNDPPRMPKIGDDAEFIHAAVAEACGEFPKCMYRLALRDGKPAGDIANPDYPMPMDLAAQLGLDNLGFKVIGRNKDSAGNLIVRLPYITKLVGTMNADMTVDVAAARAEEAQLRKLGWVDSVNKIKGLPTPPAEQPFDPVPMPDGSGNQSQAARIKESVGLDTAAQQAALAPETSPLIVPAESKESKPAIKRGQRGGRRPGAGRKPRLAGVVR